MAGPVSQREETGNAQAVATYKELLAQVIDRRPSGTRQRLATALAKNRSFISQITSASYQTPIPANHLDIIFEICHFSPAEKRQFMEAYGKAHPNRHAVLHDQHKIKAHTVYLPDLGDDTRNERLHTLVSDFVRQLARMIEEEPPKGKRR